jgi:hypothetical protein
MRFSDFLLVSDPSDLEFIVGYTEDENIRINVSDFFGNQIFGSGNPGYIPVFTGTQTLGNSQIFQDGANIVIGGVNSSGYRLAVGGSLYTANGAVINSTVLGADALRVIGGDGDIFVIPNDLGQSISSLRRIIHPPAILTTESATLGQVNTAISNLENDIDILLDLKVDKTSIGVPNGVASLDSGGKVPLSQIPDSIIGQVQYMGTWNAFTNTPTLNPLVPEERGHYYVVSAAGVFGGVDYQIGDWIISNGVIWEKVDNTDAVTSVFGRIGAILALEGDYQAFYPRLSQTYDNPTWINTLAFTKITGVPAFLLENQTITLSGDVTGSGKTSIASTISNNAVSNEKLRDSVGTSVIGRSASTTGDPADIQATTDGHVLLRSAGNLLFGLISGDSISSIDWSKITGTPTTLSGYGITNAYTKTESDNKFVPYTGASTNVNLGSNNITANSFIKAGGTSSQFLKADGSVDTSQYVPTTRSVNAGTGLTGGGNLSSDITIAFDTTWGDNRYAYRTRQLTINGITYDLSADRTWSVGTVNTLTTLNTSGPATLIGNVLNIPNYSTDLTGYVPYTGATQDLDLGTYGLISDFVRFNPSSSNIPSAEGVMSWDNTDGTVRLSLKGNTYSVPLGQSVVARVRNSTGTNLLRTNYQVVKVAGAQGQRLAVSLAQANNDANSASTIGLVCENISTNQEGFIINIGQVTSINTTGNLQGETWLDGDVLYLSPTIAGAITNIKPVAPQHTVILGYVEYSHANNGKIYVKIDNGYELEELHDVSAEPFINNGLLYRDTTLNLWKSATISTILGYTPAPQGNYITSLTGEATASGPGAASVTLLNSAVTGKVLTGLNIAGNAIVSTDSILTAFGKLQHQVNQLVGGLIYEGTWNAATNTPTITSSVGTDGTFYIVSVAGTTNINGINDWQVGDWIVFHDTSWQKVDNSDSVSSVFGRVGNIVANQSDYSAFYPLIADIKNGVLTVQGTGVLSGSGTFSANQATNNTISLTHSAVSRTDTTSAQTPSFGGAFTAVDSVTSTAEGHITAINTKTVTIPSTVATATQTGLLSDTDWINFNSKQPAGNYVTLDTTQTITGLKTIQRVGNSIDVLNFKIDSSNLYALKVAYHQNELEDAGEATWSLESTFNNGSGTGLTTTPISFFRGVLVTGERLLSVSVNDNLLEYYANYPTGRYPVYAYNTGVQQFASGVIVGDTTGLVNPATGAIADLPAGVVANFKGRVIGSNAVNNNEFATLGQVTSTSRAAISLTTTGTSGPATYSNVTGILNIPEYQGGVTSFNTRTGAVTLTSSDVTTALGYTPVTDARTLTINGVTYDLTANRSWTVAVNPSAREIQTYIATSGQTVFTVTGGYTVGLVDVFINGVRLTSSDYAATNGTTVVLVTPTMVGNIVDIIKYTSGIVNSISGTGTTNELAYFTGSTVIASLSTATYPSLTELSYVKGVTSSIQTQLNSKQNTLTNPVTGTGTTNTLPKFTGSTTIGNSLFTDNGINGGFGGANYTSGTGLRSFNISAQDYPGLSFWANNQNTANIFGLGFTGTLSLDADPSNIFSNSRIVMSTDGTERLAIFNNGNVSIANSPTDNGAKLQVSGTQTIGGVALPFLDFKTTATTGAGFQYKQISYSDATNTELWNIGFNYPNLQFLVGGTRVASFTPSGNVLIGTTTDNGAKFQLGGFSGAVNQNNGIKLTNNVGTIVGLEVGGSNDSYIGTISASNFSIRTANAPIITVTSGGNVLIGTTTNDGAKLRVEGGELRVTTSNSGVALYQNAGVGEIAAYNWGGNAYIPLVHVGSEHRFNTSATERMRITSGGNVLIGTTTDAGYKLYIPQDNNLFLSNLYITGTASNPRLSSGATGGSMSLEGGGAEEGKIYLQGAGSGGNGYIQFSAGGSLRMTISDNGSIGAPSGTNIYNPSDLRLKRNISKISNGLDKISALNPIKFNWIDGFVPSEDGKDMLGFVAQEVYDVIPEAVESFGGNSIIVNDIEIKNPLRVNEKFIIPVLVKAIQELQAKLDKNNIN